MGNIIDEKIIAQNKLTTKMEAMRGLDRPRPKYEMIKEFLLDEFQKGNYDSGKALPSENTLIQKLGVARNTVRQAVDELIKDGLVKRIHGKGSYSMSK